jgi:two-component sensor histidine kinase
MSGPPARSLHGAVEAESGARAHLERLLASWSLLADLSFSDLICYVPVRPPRGSDLASPSASEQWFATYGQIRPTTSQTLVASDLVGRLASDDGVPLVAQAFRTGRRCEGSPMPRRRSGDATTGPSATTGRSAALYREECIPIRWRSKVVAVLARRYSSDPTRTTGRLESVYLEIFDRLAEMVTAGAFPFVADSGAIEEAPRVGDGVLSLDMAGRVRFASPNAVNALHRLGVGHSILGSNLDELVGSETPVARAMAGRGPVIDELAGGRDAVVLLRCLPLLEAGRIAGAVALVRDISDLRRRDRLLLSKDATIREVHHRVKNNLQTISSLLRLQARRLDEAAGRAALLEAERRVRAISLVHEALARDPSDQVVFDDILHALAASARDSGLCEVPITVRMDGDPGKLPGEVATPLAVVVNELMQNAAEHAFVGARAHEVAQIDCVFLRSGDRLVVEIRDNGVGWPADFDLETGVGLGLSIVRDLIRTQLEGTIELTNDRGAVARLTIDCSVAAELDAPARSGARRVR